MRSANPELARRRVLMTKIASARADLDVSREVYVTATARAVLAVRVAREALDDALREHDRVMNTSGDAARLLGAAIAAASSELIGTADAAIVHAIGAVHHAPVDRDNVAALNAVREELEGARLLALDDREVRELLTLCAARAPSACIVIPDVAAEVVR